jgi:hypothetical protein
MLADLALESGPQWAGNGAEAGDRVRRLLAMPPTRLASPCAPCEERAVGGLLGWGHPTARRDLRDELPFYLVKLGQPCLLLD